METDKAPKLGPTGERVAANLKRLRGRMPVREFSTRLAEVGRPILPSGITKIEQGLRRVDADDLVALAVALGVNPSALLLPPQAGEDEVPLTSTVRAPAWAAWQWADGYAPLPTRSADDDEDPHNTPDEWSEFLRAARPADLVREAEHPLMRAVVQLRESARRVLAHASKPAEDPTRTSVVGFARRAIDRVSRELDDVEAAG